MLLLYLQQNQQIVTGVVVEPLAPTVGGGRRPGGWGVHLSFDNGKVEVHNTVELHNDTMLQLASAVVMSGVLECH